MLKIANGLAQKAHTSMQLLIKVSVLEYVLELHDTDEQQQTATCYASMKNLDILSCVHVPYLADKKVF